jgi:hypothetical protein
MMTDGPRTFNGARALGFRVRRDINARAAMAAVAWPALVAGLAHVPAAVALLPALAVARGPIGWIGVAVGLAVAAAHVRPPRPLAAPVAFRPAVLFAIAALFYAAIGLWYASRLRVSGDEPHYLLMAQSLWREGDLDLADNLAREDWRENTPGPIAPHYGAPRADGRPFPAHSPGLPLVLAPVYAVGGRLACVLVLALMAAGVTVVTWRLAAGAVNAGQPVVIAWAAALGPPIAFYAFHVYTEVPSALAATGALALLLAAPSIAGAAGAALLASALPWLHLKMIPAAVALAIIAAARLRGRPLAAFVVMSVACAAGYLAYYHAIFGTASPLAIYGGVPADADGSPRRALAGLLLDRSYGLLWHAPIFVLALAGLPDLARRRLWPHALLALAVLLPVLWWRMWWGGQCPPARFLVPLVPVLAVAVALRCERPEGLARWRWTLAALGIALTLFVAAEPGDLLLLNRADRPTRLWTALSTGDADVGRYLPSLVAADPAEARVAMVWLLGVAALLALDIASRRHPIVDRLFTGTGLPIVLSLVVGAGIDYWARAPFP